MSETEGIPWLKKPLDSIGKWIRRRPEIRERADARAPSAPPIDPAFHERMRNHPLAIVGEVTLGANDPRTLSQTEFNSSPHLLFHGAKDEFTFNPSGDPEAQSAASLDYGAGFYTTDDRKQAEIYSMVRKYGEGSPVVYSFLPFQARMLDVRARSDLESIGVLPYEFVQDWLRWLAGYVDNLDNFRHTGKFAAAIQADARNDFITRLEKAMSTGKPIVIRSMPDFEGIFMHAHSGIIDNPFRDFMLSKGFDGMIFRESGESKEDNPTDLTGYVFYNQSVIDTWQGWQGRLSSPA